MEDLPSARRTTVARMFTRAMEGMRVTAAMEGTEVITQPRFTGRIRLMAMAVATMGAVGVEVTTEGIVEVMDTATTITTTVIGGKAGPLRKVRLCEAGLDYEISTTGAPGRCPVRGVTFARSQKVSEVP